jgi:ABC-type multidrug transport system ATPase subunit
MLATINKSFYFHILVNLLVNTITIPLLDQYSTINIVASNYNLGINMFIIMTIIHCVSNVHNSYFLEPSRIEFNAIAHKTTEQYTLNMLEGISHACQKKLLDGDYQNKKSTIKWGLKNLTSQLMDNFIQVIPMIGYVIWIGYHSPFTVIIYIVSIYVCMIYNKIESVEWTEYNKNFDDYHNYRNNQYSDLIHGRGQFCHNQMAECMFNHEKTQGKDRLSEIQYTNRINIVFNIITIINCYLVLSNNENPAFIIIYIQYINHLKNNLHTFTNLFKQYKQVETDYMNYIKLFENTIPSEEVPQYTICNNITIEKNSKFIRDDFTLCVQDTLTFPMGQIVYVCGASGSGKTTLFDIMAGIIKHSETQFKVRVDECVMQNGCGHLESVRVYLVSDIRITMYKTSIYDIVTSKSLNSNCTTVHEALKFAHCDDFVNEDNLYKDDITFSKGQCNRLKVARYIYDILMKKPSIVFLDEIADGVDPEKTIKIANNLYDYFRQNNILCFVTTHLPYLQQLQYDMKINVVKGLVTQV